MTTELKIRTIVETQLIANNLKTLMEVKTRLIDFILKVLSLFMHLQMKNSGLESMLTADKYGGM